MEALNQLVTLEQDGVPREPFTSLYIRPFLFGTDEKLGIHTPHHCVFCVIASPWDPISRRASIRQRCSLEKEDVPGPFAAAPDSPNAAETTPRRCGRANAPRRRATPRCSGWTPSRGSI